AERQIVECHRMTARLPVTQTPPSLRSPGEGPDNRPAQLANVPERTGDFRPRATKSRTNREPAADFAATGLPASVPKRRTRGRAARYRGSKREPDRCHAAPQRRSVPPGASPRSSAGDPRSCANRPPPGARPVKSARHLARSIVRKGHAGTDRRIGFRWVAARTPRGRPRRELVALHRAALGPPDAPNRF